MKREYNGRIYESDLTSLMHPPIPGSSDLTLGKINDCRLKYILFVIDRAKLVNDDPLMWILQRFSSIAKNGEIVIGNALFLLNSFPYCTINREPVMIRTKVLKKDLKTEIIDLPDPTLTYTKFYAQRFTFKMLTFFKISFQILPNFYG